MYFSAKCISLNRNLRKLLLVYEPTTPAVAAPIAKSAPVASPVGSPVATSPGYLITVRTLYVLVYTVCQFILCVIICYVSLY